MWANYPAYHEDQWDNQHGDSNSCICDDLCTSISDSEQDYSNCLHCWIIEDECLHKCRKITQNFTCSYMLRTTVNKIERKYFLGKLQCTLSATAESEELRAAPAHCFYISVNNKYCRK